jgi:hypothetical protein
MISLPTAKRGGLNAQARPHPRRRPTPYRKRHRRRLPPRSKNRARSPNVSTTPTSASVSRRNAPSRIAMPKSLGCGPNSRPRPLHRAPSRPAEKFPAYAQYLETNPEASLEDYIDARQDFRDGLKQKATVAERENAERTRSHQEGIEQAQARTRAARQADPVIDAKFKAWESAQSVHELPEILLLKTRDQASRPNRSRSRKTISPAPWPPRSSRRRSSRTSRTTRTCSRRFAPWRTARRS